MFLALHADPLQESTFPADNPATGAFNPQPVDPIEQVGLTIEEQNYRLRARGVAGVGCPYFALVSPWFHIGLITGQPKVRLSITMSVNALPQQLTAPDEEHVFAELQPGGIGIPADQTTEHPDTSGLGISIALTPDGRLVYRPGQVHVPAMGVTLPPVVRTPAGTIKADGSTFQVDVEEVLQSDAITTLAKLSINGSAYISEGYRRRTPEAEFPIQLSCRWMFFNGVTGLSRFNVTINRVRAYLESAANGGLMVNTFQFGLYIPDVPKNIEWIFEPDPSSGTVTGTELEGSASRNHNTSVWTLTPRFYLPSQDTLGILPDLWGQEPPSLNACFRFGFMPAGPSFIQRNPGSGSFTPSTPSGSFSKRGLGGSTFNPVTP